MFDSEKNAETGSSPISAAYDTNEKIRPDQRDRSGCFFMMHLSVFRYFNALRSIW